MIDGADLRSGGSGAVAVLGATGCVGRQVCAAFARTGRDILGIARHHGPQVSDHKFVSLDVAAADPAELAELLASHRVEVVVNATGGWVLTEEAMRHVHVQLIEGLLTATALMTRRPRIVQIGSIHEYGSVPNGVPIDETITPNPTTPYASTKHAGSAAILAATRAGKADGVVLRAVNVCGPYTTQASFLGAVMGMLREATPEQGLELSIADARRDYLDVRDLADAAVKAAEAPAVGRAINIGRAKAVSMRELVSLLVSVVGFPQEAIRERNAQVESKGGSWTQADITLAGTLLGWHPRVSLRDSLRDMWETAGH